MDNTAQAPVFVAVVTLFIVVGFEDTVSTNWTNNWFIGAFRRFPNTSEAILDQTSRTTAVSRHFVSIIAGFGNLSHSVSAHWIVSEANRRKESTAGEAIVDFAVGRAPETIPVVALLASFHDAVATEATN